MLAKHFILIFPLHENSFTKKVKICIFFKKLSCWVQRVQLVLITTSELDVWLITSKPMLFFFFFFRSLWKCTKNASNCILRWWSYLPPNPARFPGINFPLWTPPGLSLQRLTTAYTASYRGHSGKIILKAAAKNDRAAARKQQQCFPQPDAYKILTSFNMLADHKLLQYPGWIEIYSLLASWYLLVFPRCWSVF